MFITYIVTKAKSFFLGYNDAEKHKDHVFHYLFRFNKHKQESCINFDKMKVDCTK